MGRSVMVHPDSVKTIYLFLELEDELEYYDLIDFLRELITQKYPSFYNTNTWHGNECRIILENYHAQIVLSEYCGVFAVSLVPREDVDINCYNLALSWCAQIENNFETLIKTAYPKNCLIRLGTFSNGESAYKFRDNSNRGTVVERGEVI